MRGTFTYHLHVTDRRGSALSSEAHISRTGFSGATHRVSQNVMSLDLGDFHIHAGTPLDQAIACAEAVLTALVLYREQATPDAYDHA